MKRLAVALFQSMLSFFGVIVIVAIPLALLSVAGVVLKGVEPIQLNEAHAKQLQPPIQREADYSEEELEELIHDADPLLIDRVPGFSPIIYAE